MISYKDQTWCSSDCVNKKCHRMFTADEREKAIRWWGNDDVPVAMYDFSTDCPDYLRDDS